MSKQPNQAKKELNITIQNALGHMMREVVGETDEITLGVDVVRVNVQNKNIKEKITCRLTSRQFASQTDTIKTTFSKQTKERGICAKGGMGATRAWMDLPMISFVGQAKRLVIFDSSH